MKFKRDSIQKIAATVLAIGLAAQSVTVPVFADDASSGEFEQTDASGFEVDINLGLPCPNAEFTVTLKNSAKSYTGTSTISEDGSSASAYIHKVPIGTYDLEIAAPGFATYEQSGVEIKKNHTALLELYNNESVNDTQEENAKFGIIPVGDITGDDVVDEADAEEMAVKIESNEYDKTYDLNGDGNVDIGDLTYIAKNYTNGEKTYGNIVYSIAPENIRPAASENTNVVGNISDITEKSDTFVQLAPSSDEAISENNPVEVSFDIAQPSAEPNEDNQPEVNDVAGIVIKPPIGSENRIRSGVVYYTYEVDGKEVTGEAVIEDDTPVVEVISLFDLFAAAPTGEERVVIESDGTVVINLGNQVAIKKVTIKVTGSSTKLVDIAEVEFVNNMEDRIPAPELNIPSFTEIRIGQDGKESNGMTRSFYMAWTQQTNVDSYEISITDETGTERVYNVGNSGNAKPQYTVEGFGKGKIEFYKKYTFRIRSTNGDWKSPYSDPVDFTPTPPWPPKAPEYVKATGAVGAVNVSWRDLDGAAEYIVEYKKSSESEAEYKKIEGIKTTSYLIGDLGTSTKYDVRVYGKNEKGTGPASAVNSATTSSGEMPKMPLYGLINKNGVENITSIVAGNGNLLGENGKTPADPYAIVDSSQATYVEVHDWDVGNIYGNAAFPVITLNKQYTMNTVCFAAAGDQQYTYSGASIRYKDPENGNRWAKVSVGISKKADAEGNSYYELKLPKAVTTDTIQICLTTGGRRVTISEVCIYEYSDIEKRINELYADSMHLKLAEGVNETQINALLDEVEKPDSSGETHPHKDQLKSEITFAKELLSDTAVLPDIINISTSITNRADGNVDFVYMPSDYQPLGMVAEAGEEIIVYVGSSTDDFGTELPLEFIATQNRAEASAWSQSCGKLKVGKNVIKIPQIATKSQVENGGSLYVAYSGNKSDLGYSVRISGGHKIPMLNVAGVKGTARKNAITKYYDELTAHVKELTNKHGSEHPKTGADGKELSAYKLSYNEDCILNYTEIVMDNAMFSVPAKKVTDTLESNGGADQLQNAIEAMEQEMDLMYQHKGLIKDAPSNSTDRYPTQRYNFRSHTMFAGAFMYIGGKHIGLKAESVSDLIKATKVVTDSLGKYQSGGYSGWAIGHEIGHGVNSNKYDVAETTNNYFAMLATAPSSGNRIATAKDYNQVTKGIEGEAPSLTMYWQLHLAYDNYYDNMIFDNEQDQFANLIYARMDRYARNQSLAPKPKNIPLTMTKESRNQEGKVIRASKPDNFMRLACAGAEKNLLPFFKAWGYTPNEDTVKYCEQFPEETRKIQYLNDDARNYRLSKKTGMPANTTVTASYKDEAELDDKGALNKAGVKINLGNSAPDNNDMLGYEIYRNGAPIAFVKADQTTYTDSITTGNNKVYQYDVVGYDKLLNTTDKVSLKPIKVKHDGTILPEAWVIETNLVSDDDLVIKADADNGYCEDFRMTAIERCIGRSFDDKTGPYIGRLAQKTDEAYVSGEPTITFNFNNMEKVTAITYSGKPVYMQISLSKDNVNWDTLNFEDHPGGEKTYYLHDMMGDLDTVNGLMNIYDAAYLRLMIFPKDDSETIEIDKISILGPTSDNVELFQNGIGKLKTDLVYDDSDPERYKIPAGSIICTGNYKGNPAYNVVKLLDQDRQIINGYQVIFADVPEHGELGNVSDGTWIYVLKEPDDQEITMPTKVMAELYRVDNAQTNENERLVSDTLFVEIPEELPQIEIKSNKPATVAEINASAVIEQANEVTDLIAAPVVIDTTDEYEETPSRGKPDIREDEDPDEEYKLWAVPGEEDIELEPDSTENTEVSEDAAQIGDAADTPVITDTVQPDDKDTPSLMAEPNNEETTEPSHSKGEPDEREDETPLEDSGIWDVPEDEPDDGTVVFTPDSAMKSADMALKLEKESGYTVAFQVDFDVTSTSIDDVSDVSFEWAEEINGRKPLYKKAVYDKTKRKLSLYVVVGYDMITKEGIANLGTVTIIPVDNDIPQEKVNIAVDSNSFVSVYDDLKVSNTRFVSGSVELNMGVVKAQIINKLGTSMLTEPAILVAADGTTNYLVAVVSRADVESGKIDDVQFVHDGTLIDSAATDGDGCVYSAIKVGENIYYPSDFFNINEDETPINDDDYCLYAIEMENDSNTSKYVLKDQLVDAVDVDVLSKN